MWNNDSKAFLDTIYEEGLYSEFANSLFVTRLKLREQIGKILKDPFPKIMEHLAQIRRNAILKLLYHHYCIRGNIQLEEIDFYFWGTRE